MDVGSEGGGEPDRDTNPTLKPHLETRMRRHKLTILPNAEGYGTHHLHLDDQDISRGVRSLNLSLNPGDFPRVELEMAVVEIDRMEFETPHLFISEATKVALIALGWLAPPSDEPPAVVLPPRPGMDAIVYVGGQACRIVGVDRKIDLSGGPSTISLLVEPASEVDA